MLFSLVYLKKGWAETAKQLKKKKKYKTEIGIKAKQNIFCEYYEKYLS